MKTIGKQALFASLVAALLAPGWACAQLYFGGTVGQTNNEWTPTGLKGDKDTSTFVKPFVGINIAAPFAVEFGLANLGKIVNFSSTTASVEARSLGVTLVGTVAANKQIDMFARLGVGIWNAKWGFNGSSGTKTGSGTVVGLGANFRFAFLPDNMRLGFEWEQYQNVGEGAMAAGTRLMGQNVDTLGIRFVYHLDRTPGR